MVTPAVAAARPTASRWPTWPPRSRRRPSGGPAGQPLRARRAACQRLRGSGRGPPRCGLRGQPACSGSPGGRGTARPRRRPSAPLRSARGSTAAPCRRPRPARAGRSRSQRMPCGSRPLSGSSSTRIAGSPSRADASPSRWRIPVENVPTRRSAASSPSPTTPSTSSTRPRGRPAEHGERAQVVARRSGRDAHRSAPDVDPEHARAGVCRVLDQACRRRAPVRAVGRAIPTRSALSAVVLPAPFGPRNPVTEPGPNAERQVLDRRPSSPYRLVRWERLMVDIGRLLVGGASCSTVAIRRRGIAGPARRFPHSPCPPRRAYRAA